MTTKFPAEIDQFENPRPDTSQATARTHSQQHGDANDAIEAVQRKVGTNDSADPDTLDFKVGALENVANGLDTAAFHPASDFATAAQGQLAVGAVQSGEFQAVTSAIDSRMDSIEAGQATSAIYANTLPDLQAVAGTFVGQGAFVLNGSGAGQYRWDGSEWQFLRADMLASKLDATTFQQSVLRTDLPGLLAAIGDASGFVLSWIQARSSDGLLTDYATRAIEQCMPLLPTARYGDPAQDPTIGLRMVDNSSPPVRYWIEANSADGLPTEYTKKVIRDVVADGRAAELKYVGEGDSMMASNYGGGQTIPVILGGLLGRTVINYAVSGSTASEIGIRAGGVVPILNVAAGSIPPNTTPIPVTWDVQGPFSGAGQPARTYLGTVQGVPCQLVQSPADGSLALNRITAGAIVPLPPSVAFIPSEQYGNGYTHILFGGRNNEPKSTALAVLQASMDWYEQMGDNYLIVSVTNKNNEPSGSAGYAEIVALNNQLRKLRPRNYVDLRGRMIREGLDIAGLTPTAEDILAISQDRIPESLIYTDGLHFNQIGREVASKILLDELTQRRLTP
ncbi:hypothetical protein [Stenotrophomonas maltophilia]|uniref:hypothetical protein n=1 Tax=Stenotrophomonas maltophilia TaxID=40324 RepID=UPI000F65DDA8|nr:hypothetical protein [Stenotrophomonas maltophilia]RRU74164.1 hypothetical protein EGJ89_07545 [Stenotrophomonas maltophilia]